MLLSNSQSSTVAKVGVGAYGSVWELGWAVWDGVGPWWSMEKTIHTPGFAYWFPMILMDFLWHLCSKKQDSSTCQKKHLQQREVWEDLPCSWGFHGWELWNQGRGFSDYHWSCMLYLHYRETDTEVQWSISQKFRSRTDSVIIMQLVWCDLESFLQRFYDFIVFPSPSSPRRSWPSKLRLGWLRILLWAGLQIMAHTSLMGPTKNPAGWMIQSTYLGPPRNA